MYKESLHYWLSFAWFSQVIFICFIGVRILTLSLTTRIFLFLNDLNTSQLNFKSPFWFLQTFWMWTFTDSLCSCGFKYEVQPIPSDQTGPQRDPPAWLWNEDSVCGAGEPTLQTGDPEVRTVEVLCASDLRFEVPDAFRSFSFSQPALKTDKTEKENHIMT